MRTKFMLPFTALLLLAASAAFASFGGGGKSQPPATPPSSTTPTDEQAPSTGARREAQSWYNDAYNDVAKAKREVEEGKTKNAEKHFRKAIERAERAVGIDSTYHEAWNLIGYASRSLKDYDYALVAYQRCLAVKPDYAPAREYLAEAYLLLNQPAKAREQMAWLEKSGASDELVRIKAAWDDWAKAHPDQSAAVSGTSSPSGAATTASTPPDSASAGAQKP
jgi:tetratricopeptide (TPR) repeat protein